MNFTRQTIPTVSAVPEEPKQETAKQATVNIRVDANCTMLCDGEYIETQFQANKITKMNLPLGQHLLEFFDMDYPDVIVEQEVDWQEEGKAYLVIIKGLQEKIEAARQADEEKKRMLDYIMNKLGTRPLLLSQRDEPDPKLFRIIHI